MRGTVHKFANDDGGASMVEFSITVFLLLILMFGVIEFSFLFYQWNSATKAGQHGGRFASVSDPVSSDIVDIDGLGGTVVPGDPMPYFTRVCNGASQTCSDGGTYDSAAMDTLVYGRGETICGTVGPDGVPGMCEIYPRVRPQNVIITYENTGLGFAGRPSGPVPTITIELTGLNYGFVFLNALLNFTPIALPPMRTTATGEDLSTSY